MRREPAGGVAAFYDDGLGSPVAGVRRHEFASVHDIEDEANVFAGALLMPPRLLRRVFDECSGDLAHVADTFRCSLSAVDPRHHALRHWSA